jgi:hypothetical protein
MSKPIHVIVTLCPETIAALAEALRPKQAAPRVLKGRPPYASAAEPLDVARALEGRASVTVRELCDALAIPEERRDQAAATRLGTELRRLGWSPTQRGGGGLRERVYRAAPLTDAASSA